MSHLSGGNKYKSRRLVSNPSPQCDIDRQGRAAIDKVQSQVGLTMTDQHRKESISMKSNQVRGYLPEFFFTFRNFSKMHLEIVPSSNK